MKTSTRGRLAGHGIVALAAVAGVMGSFASASWAESAPTRITISADRLYVGETYPVTIHCEVRSTVGVAVDVDPYSAEQSDLIGGAPVAPNEELLATVQWTPAVSGRHTIYAYGCARGVGWPNGRPPTATLIVDVAQASPGTGSADAIAVIGQRLSKLFG